MKTFKTPKKITLDGKEYLVFGVTESSNPMAIAQFKTKFGYKDVKNLSIRSKLSKKI